MKRHTDSDRTQVPPEKMTYKCNVCYQAFIQRSALNMHNLMHANDFPYACETCDKLFARKQLIETHSRTHLSVADRPFKCNVCCKRFSQKGALNGHMRIHTGERPYSCDMCDKRFALKSYVDAHMNTHLSVEERPFECDVCNQKFTQKGTLNIHRRRHTGERPYACEICNEKFAAKSYLTYHINARHMFENSSLCDVPRVNRVENSSTPNESRISHVGRFREGAEKNYNEQPITSFKQEPGTGAGFEIRNATEVMIHCMKVLANEAVPLSRVHEEDTWNNFRI